MFDVFAKLLSSIASFLFPVFASYKAIETSDPAQLKPWLMYWVVLSCVVLVESWTDWLLVWIPFYAYLRFFFLLYLILPQTQGARVIYTQHIHPYLKDNEAQIEEVIATTHDRIKAAGIAYFKRAIEVLRTTVLGLPPDPNAAAAATAASREPEVPASRQPRTYTQALLARFRLPDAPAAPKAAAAYTGKEFYNMLAGAVSAATAAVSQAAASTTTAGAPSSKSDLTASGTLIPPDIRGTDEKMSFIAAQRERLAIVLSALDREAAQLRTSQERAAARGEHEAAEEDAEEDSPTQRPASGLSKSRSEVDFEKIEAESGAEDVDDTAGGKRRTPAASGAAGGWLSWGWGSGGAASTETVKSPAGEHAKTE